MEPLGGPLHVSEGSSGAPPARCGSGAALRPGPGGWAASRARRKAGRRCRPRLISSLVACCFLLSLLLVSVSKVFLSLAAFRA